MNTISMDKKYKTRDGRDVRVLCVDRTHPRYPVIALIFDTDGVEEYSAFSSTGGFHGNGHESDSDLIEQPKEHTIDVWAAVFTNVIKGNWAEIFRTEQDAKDYAYHRGFGIKALQGFTLTLKEGETLDEQG
jgi:hypothetical protein